MKIHWATERKKKLQQAKISQFICKLIMSLEIDLQAIPQEPLKVAIYS